MILDAVTAPGVCAQPDDGRDPTSLLFVDLDGTVRHGHDELGRFVNVANDVVIFPDAARALRAWKAQGGRIVGVSNQGGIALGYMTAAANGEAMRATWERSGRTIDVLAWCPHAPDAGCWCRKPRPGLPVEAATRLAIAYPAESYPTDRMLFVGDRPEDEACADALGITFLAAAAWRRVHGQEATA